MTEIRRRKGALEVALKADKELVRQLIKVRDEGWTSAGEADGIKYLHMLQ